MQFLRVFTLALLLPSLAYAQQAVKIGGVDHRIPPLESQYLSQEAATAMQQAARAAAMLTIEQQDHAATTKDLAELRAWVAAYFAQKKTPAEAGAK